MKHNPGYLRKPACLHKQNGCHEQIDLSKFNITESGQVIKGDKMKEATCIICGKTFMSECGELACTECTKKLLVQHKAPISVLDVHKEDLIGHPNHYCEGRKFEPKDVIRDWNLNFNLGNAVKYISRNGRKDGNSALQDLKKARQYLDFEIEYLEKEDK